MSRPPNKALQLTSGGTCRGRAPMRRSAPPLRARGVLGSPLAADPGCSTDTPRTGGRNDLCHTEERARKRTSNRERALFNTEEATTAIESRQRPRPALPTRQQRAASHDRDREVPFDTSPRGWRRRRQQRTGANGLPKTDRRERTTENGPAQRSSATPKALTTVVRPAGVP